MNRRDFLKGVMGAAVAVPALKAFADGRPKLDPTRVLLLADLHVQSYDPVRDFTSPRLEKCVREIMSAPTIPATCIVFGDVSRSYGLVEDYRKARQILRPIEDAGVKFLYGMGNHDRRENFAKVYPEQAKTLVADRIVNALETEHVDFLMLDTLQQVADPRKYVTPGNVDDAQKAFLREFLAGRTKPVIVCAHHVEGVTQTRDILLASKCVKGFIHGHEHGWKAFGVNPRLVRRLGLPTTGHWGDIGYATLTLTPKFVRAQCRAIEYYDPVPAKPGEDVPLSWQLRPQEIDGALVHFTL